MPPLPTPRPDSAASPWPDSAASVVAAARGLRRPRAPRRSRAGGSWWAVLLAVLLTAPLGLGGCERVTSVLEDKAHEVADNLAEPDADADAPAPTRDELLARKLRLYAECRARSSARIRDSWARFDERIDDDGTLRRRGTQPFLYKIDAELAPCEAALDRGPTMDPALPELDRALVAYVEHARRFAALSVQLDRYFETEAYADDDWAEGRDLGPRLRETWPAWEAADVALDQQIATLQEQLDRAALRDLDPQGLAWHARTFMLEARAFMGCAEGPEASADACRKLHATLAQAHADLLGTLESRPDDVEGVFWMSAFRDSAATFVTRADDALDQLRRDPLSERDARPLKRAFDALRSDSNNLRFE